MRTLSHTQLLAVFNTTCTIIEMIDDRSMKTDIVCEVHNSISHKIDMNDRLSMKISDMILDLSVAI